MIASWLWWLVCRALGVPSIDPVMVDAMLVVIREEGEARGL